MAAPELIPLLWLWYFVVKPSTTQSSALQMTVLRMLGREMLMITFPIVDREVDELLAKETEADIPTSYESGRTPLFSVYLYILVLPLCHQ